MLLGINHQINLPIYFTSLHAPPGKLNRETTDIEFTFEEKCPRRKKLVRTVDRGQKWKRSLEVSKAALHALLHVWRRCPLAKVPRFRRACAIKRWGTRIPLSIATRLKLLVSRNRSNCVGHENIAVRHELLFAILRKKKESRGETNEGMYPKWTSFCDHTEKEVWPDFARHTRRAFVIRRRVNTSNGYHPDWWTKWGEKKDARELASCTILWSNVIVTTKRKTRRKGNA